MVWFGISFIHYQISTNGNYAMPFLFQGIAYWIIRHAKGGANYEYLTSLPVISQIVKLFIGYTEKAANIAMYAGAGVGYVLNGASNIAVGTEGIGAGIGILFACIPCIVVSAIVGYAIIFPLSYLGIMGEVADKIGQFNRSRSAAA